MLSPQGFMHTIFFLEQTVGQIRGATEALKMPSAPLTFWAIVNLIWASLSFYAATVEPYQYEDGETVFGWDWDLIFWITTVSVVVLNAIKLLTAKIPQDTQAESEETEKINRQEN